MRRIVFILLISICLAASGAVRPAYAGLLSGPDSKFNLAMFSLGSIGFSAVAYYIYKNSPAERARGIPESLGPGEWYVGAYSGLSYLPPSNWDMAAFASPYNGRTARDIAYQPNILGGLKFGRYFDEYPWFGIEVETNFSRQSIKGGSGTISPPVPGGSRYLLGEPDRFYIWAMQANLLARYGFLKDKEVPFGRLQPYVGLGPGFEILYGTTDSAKNFAIETLAGIRYMLTQSIGIFCEYKFSYQFKVEYENIQVSLSPVREGTATFDVPHHRFALGVSYHFKNLFGN